MRRDRAINLFLFFVLAALLFVSFYPVYFSYDQVHTRVVDISERVFSLLFVMLWIALCVYSSWKKKFYLVLGGATFAVLAYIPDWVLPLIGDQGKGIFSVVQAIFRFIFERLFELINAPMVGFSILFSEKTSVSLSKWLLPLLVISYAGTQIIRHYRNAYLADKLHLEEMAYYPNPDLAHEIASPRAAGGAPQGTTLSRPAPAKAVSESGTQPAPAPVIAPPGIDVIDLAEIRRVSAPESPGEPEFPGEPELPGESEEKQESGEEKPLRADPEI